METQLRLRHPDHLSAGELTAARRGILTISVLGNLSIAFNGHEVRIKSRKSRAVLAFLALNESWQETRERVVGLFWSESEEQKARASLRQTLRELRIALLDAGYHGLQTEKLAIELDADSVEVDLLSVIDAAEEHRAHRMILNRPRVAESILEGLEDLDPEFRVWLLAKRRTFQDRLIRALEAGLAGPEDGTQRKKLLAQAVVNLDPTHEEACRYLMQARAAEGDTAGALRVYKELWDLLDEEYGMEPSARTQQLVADIKQGSLEPSSPAATPATLGVTRIIDPPLVPPPGLGKIALLVSQFQMNGVTPEKVHLVQGFRHHLIASLVRFREWGVVDGAAPSSTQPEASNTPQYGIDATAYQAGESVNIVLTLRQNKTNFFVWSETFELKLENWFEVQQRIIRRTTSSLNVQLSAERLAQLAREPDVSLEIYDRWLRGQAMILRFSPDNWQRAVELFTESIRDAPHFSPSFSSLVQLNNTVQFAYPGVFRDRAKAEHTIELARTAVQLDPVDSRAQLCMGWSLTLADRHAEAEMHMDLACELNENDPWTLMSSALYYAFCGKFDRATRLANEACDLSLAPGPQFLGYHSVIHFLGGNYDGTLEVTKHPINITEILPAVRAAALHHLGRHDESVHEARRFISGIRARWYGKDAPTDLNIARWLLHVYPIARREDWQRLRDGIYHAGIAVAGLEHGRW
jgi:DNA-binding SARP family transcriptional activator/TolB-like protein